MNVAQLTPDQVADAFGWPGAIVIVSLAAALIFTVRLLLKSYDMRDALQEKRIADAKEARDSLVEPLKKSTELSQQIYDIVLRTKGN